MDSRSRDLVGESAAWQAVVADARRVAPTDVSVLLLGPTGTGKSVLARAIHTWSPRDLRPFVVANLGATPKSLVEARLKGHARGAFTGADDDRLGLLEQAGEGTLFLDEIGDAPHEVQVALLDVLERREFCRLGETKPRPFRARVMAATHRAVGPGRCGRLREDLYFRLAGFEIALPSLREREGDVVLLAMKELGPRSRLSRDFFPALGCYSWPGNVRELHQVLREARIRAGQKPLRPEHLPARVRPPQGSVPRLLAERIVHRQGQVSRRDLTAWGVAPATATRALAQLEREGTLRQCGRGPASRYLPGLESPLGLVIDLEQRRLGGPHPAGRDSS